MRWNLAPLVVLLVSLPTSVPAQSHSASVARSAGVAADKTPPYVDGEILVRFQPSASSKSRAQAHGMRGSRVRERYRSIEGLERVELPAGTSVEDGIRAYQSDPSVAYAEPNYLVEAFATPNDPRLSELWGLNNTGQLGGVPDADIDAPEAWDVTTGSSQVVIAVIDTGMDYTHPDLAPNMYRNPSECPPNGVDDDLNGWVDDCYGIDTVFNDGDPHSGGVDDHATHVAGTIGGRGNNGVGVAGVNWDVRIMACKFLNRGSGSTANAVRCLDYIALMKERGVNIVATNNSWGSTAFSQALLDAIDVQREHGILFVAAAGNSAVEGPAQFPAGYYLPNIITVAATTRSDALAAFSNFGATSVHLGAPGQAIVSSVPGNGYQSFSGTSMAAPHVTGVIGLLAAQDPTRDWRALRNLVLTGGDDVAALQSTTVTGKRLNANGAVRCTDSTVAKRLRPLRDVAFTNVNGALGLAVLHARCADPAGEVDVQIEPGGDSVTLTDDGLGFDQEAGDGVYSAQWIPTIPGVFTLRFPSGDDVTVQVGPQTLVSPDASAGDLYGFALAADGGRLLVGEPWDAGGASQAGAAHLIDAATGLEVQRFANPEPAAVDSFGWAVALDGNLAAVAAPYDDFSAVDAGSVYVFDASTGALLQTLRSPAPSASALFGNSIAFVGGNLLVGCPGDSVTAEGAGAAYIYEPLSGALLGTLANPEPVYPTRNYFGWAVAARGSQAVVSAPAAPAALAMTPDGIRISIGRVHLLDADPDSAAFESVIRSMVAFPPAWDSPFGVSASFGYSVATLGNDILVGDPNATLSDPGNWTGSGPAPFSGIAFLLDGDTGQLKATFLPPFFDNFMSFGWSVAGSDGHVIVGATNDSLGRTQAGAAYVFEADTGAPLAALFNPGIGTGDLYGNAVAAMAGELFVGAPRDDTAAIDAGIVHRSAAPDPLDRFRCYKSAYAPGTVKLPTQELVLADEREIKHTSVLAPTKACNPSSQSGSQLADAGAYLTCHKVRDVRGQAKLTPFDVRLVGTFGGETLTVKKATELCVVSGRSGSPVAGAVDHFKCYQAKPPKTAPKYTFKRNARLDDEFESKNVSLVKPVAFCNPVAVNGGSLKSPDNHLVCYLVKEAKGQAPFLRPTLEVSSLLGSAVLATKKADMLCVPARLVPAT